MSAEEGRDDTKYPSIIEGESIGEEGETKDSQGGSER
jgi:hypothetical protein